MIRPDVIWLITENSRTHGVHEDVTDAERMVYCTVKSVTRSEYYAALNVGIRPEYIFELALAEDYHGERLAKFHDQKYRIIRTYETDSGSLELTAERSDVNGEETDQDDDSDNA